MNALSGRFLRRGGGQVLRPALSLAALTGAPVRIERIRARRSKPGLRPQHLTAVQAVARVSQAEVTGAHPGRIFRFPGPDRGRATAGARGPAAGGQTHGPPGEGGAGGNYLRGRPGPGQPGL
ncbi:MAG: hypothetical protein COS90_10940 [Deltaproteobacteria bacterium CG07_land_8_20_14_0_80_60_11]|nr:MAG: hypothetical protein COS90_10940 [Deltaproteobacteria bacterium CG07_land_8_20_14_0_80_60_11]